MRRLPLPMALVALLAGGVVAAGEEEPKDAAERRHVKTKEGRCDACHVPDGWTPARFVHERTGFALVGRHAGVGCAGCHPDDDRAATPRACAGCHRDPHGQELGSRCDGCHTEESFAAPLFSVAAHRRTAFPLIGRHGALPCEECHVEKRERTFSRVAVACASCHQKDALRASRVTLDHARPPLSIACERCHDPMAFAPARFAEHEPCFPIGSGVHAPVRCAECHGNLRGARVDGDCDGVSVKCASCHDHRRALEDRRHAAIPGYAHDSARCVACHGPAG